MTVTPEAGESFYGWLERLAAAQHTTTAALGTIIDPDLIRLGQWSGALVALSDDTYRRIEAFTGIARTVIAPMLLSAFDGSALDLGLYNPERPDTLKKISPSLWCYPSYTLACPHCIGEGKAWQVTWKLAYVFACLDHNVLLIDRCERCGHQFHELSRTHRNGPPVPGECNNTVDRQRCGHPIAYNQAPSLTDYPETLATARSIQGALHGNPPLMFGEAVTSRAFFDLLATAARATRAVTTATALRFGAPPEYALSDDAEVRITRVAPLNAAEAIVPLTVAKAWLAGPTDDTASVAATVWRDATRQDRDRSYAALQGFPSSPVRRVFEQVHEDEWPVEWGGDRHSPEFLNRSRSPDSES